MENGIVDGTELNDATKNLLSLARRHFKMGQYPAAAELLEAYVARRPRHGQAWWWLGTALRDVGRTVEARKALRIALRLSRRHRGIVALQLAMLYHGRGNRARAEKWFARAASARDARDRDCVWVLRGGNFAGWEKFDEAAACHREAIELHDRNEEEAHLNLGLVLRTQRDYVGAAAEFHQALAISPDYPEATESLASLEGVGDALKLIDTMEHDPARWEDLGDRIFALARGDLELDHEAAAVELLAVYVARRPLHAAAWWRYGNALRILGRKGESRRALLTARRLTKDHKGSAAAQLAMLYEARGKRATADKWFARAASAGDTADLDWIPLLRGANFMAWGKFEKAIASLTQAIEMHGCNEDDAHVKLGMVYRAQQHYGEAAREFREALRITPEHAEAMKGLASIDGVDEALTLIEKLQHGGA